VKNCAVGLSLFAGLACVCSVASADFFAPNGVNAPWTRGVTGFSAYAQWEVFTSVAGPNAPDAGHIEVGVLPALPAFNVAASGATASVLGSGNIYSAGNPLSVTVTFPSFGFGAGVPTYVILQTRTQGTEINPATMLINGLAPTSVTELSRVSLGPQGAMVDTAWRWDLPASAPSYAITFTSGGPFFSLDRVAVDEFAEIPGPGAAGLIGLGILGVSRRRR
jgi:hypothetical protein